MRTNRAVFAAILTAVAVAVAGCGSTSGAKNTPATVTTSSSDSGSRHSMSGDSMSGDAPMADGDQLVVDGKYSDERFTSMMTAHHEMAVEMARVAVREAQHPALKTAAQQTVDDQSAEISQLKAITARLGGTAMDATMSETAMDNTGMVPTEQLAKMDPFDRAFIDSMIPHHAGAIEMSSVALLRSSDPEIKALARQIIDAQSKEIGQMIAWRDAWYGK